VTLSLSMPVLVTDVGLKSANDCPHRDPVDFDIVGLLEGEEVWSIEVRGHAFTSRWQTHCFITETLEPCDEVQLRVLRSGSPHEVQLGQIKLFGAVAHPDAPDAPHAADATLRDRLKLAEQRALIAEARAHDLEAQLRSAAAGGGGAPSL
jgi:hypothetical protein